MTTSIATTRVNGLVKSGVRASSVTSRLVRVYRDASPEMVTAGRAWYPLANDIAEDIAALTDTPKDTVICVIAALSPQLPWAANIAGALEFCESGTKKSGILGSSFQRARDVMAASNPYGAALGKGPKIHSFAANIRGNVQPVTIDTWAVRAAMGTNAVATLGVSFDTFLKRTGVYSDLADCYRRAAAIVGESPSAFQAIVWCHTRGAAN